MVTVFHAPLKNVMDTALQFKLGHYNQLSISGKARTQTTDAVL